MQKRIAQIATSQGFTFSLFAAVLAAALVPEIGMKGGPLKTEVTTQLAVALIFFIQGLSLPTRQIVHSSTKFRLHAYCQIAIFGAAPLLMLGFLAVFGQWIHPGMRAGFFFLAALPTTISSAIVLTSNSEGDSASALFSTTLSNLLGIFLTPLLCSFFIVTATAATPSMPALIGKLSLLVLLPLALGQLARPFVRDWATRSKVLFKRSSNSLIVFVVFAAFCESVRTGIWTEVGTPSVLATVFLSGAFLLLLSALVWYSAPIAARSRPERIAAFFCGSHKTLAAGIPMASVLFAHLEGDANFSLGLVILPIMCFHPLQLLLGGVVSPSLAKWAR